MTILQADCLFFAPAGRSDDFDPDPPDNLLTTLKEEIFTGKKRFLRKTAKLSSRENLEYR